ncbi:hypothetical protein BH23CHL5_BH23CHL5_26120 [soil metagenome]
MTGSTNHRITFWHDRNSHPGLASQLAIRVALTAPPYGVRWIGHFRTLWLLSAGPQDQISQHRPKFGPESPYRSHGSPQPPDHHFSEKWPIRYGLNRGSAANHPRPQCIPRKALSESGVVIEIGSADRRITLIGNWLPSRICLHFVGYGRMRTTHASAPHPGY